MKFLIFIVLAFAIVPVVSAQMPPLIDRDLFFGNPEYSGSQISPDGKYISFVKPLNGVRNVWVKGIDEPMDKARPLTAETKRPIADYFWSWDGKYVLFSKDNGGDENFNIFAVSPSASAAAGSLVPTPTNITGEKGVETQIYNLPESEPDYIYIGINDRDKAWHDLYKVQISTGTKTLLRQNKDRITGWVFDNAGNIRLATRALPDGTTEILKVDGDKFTTIYSCGIFESCSPAQFDKDNKLVYMATNKGDRDLVQLVLLDPDTGKEKLVEQDPLGRVDLENVNFSNVTKELIATVYDDDKLRIYWKDKKYEADYNFLRSKLGNNEVAIGSGTRDESKFIVSSFSDVDPGTVWLFDRKTRNLSKLYQSREKLDRGALSPMRAIRYKSSDGLEIPAYLTMPKGAGDKNLPLIVIPHGGPWARDSWGYNPWVQFWANRGYAVLEPNFRASTGYGKKFLDAGNLQWGDKMQDDITWGVKYLVQQGVADPKRVGIMGGSYGGYATLAGVTFTPDVYAAAVAYCAPSNLSTLLKSIPPYWEAGRVVFYKRMGDPNNAAGKSQLDRQSPLNSASKIKTPLMVVQGANDPRVNKAEADQIVIALRDRNYPVQYILADDEGHGFQRPVNNMAMFASSEKFFAKYLGGRYQESMTPDVAKRLGEITVDPKTVSLAKPVDMSVAAAADLSGKWTLVADAGGQQVEMDLDLLQKGSDLSGSSSSPLGNGTLDGGKVSGNKFMCTMHAEIQGQPVDFTMDGNIDGDKMVGNFANPSFGSIPFTAVRKK